MTEIKLLGPADYHYLDNVAEDVFDDPIIEISSREFLSDPRHRLMVALDDDLVVGFVSAVVYLHPDKSRPELWINEIGVAPTRQRQGIGKALLRVMLEHARQSGCTEAWVLTERDNMPAMVVCKSAGGVESSGDPTMFTFKL